MAGSIPERWFEAIVLASPDPILVIDHEFEFRLVSPSFRTALGYDDYALADASAYNLIHPDDAPELLQKLRFILDAGATGQELDATFRIRHAGGEWETVQVRMRALVDAAGAVEAALLMVRNVTPFHTMAAALRESETRYRELFEEANDIIYTADLDGRVTSANAAAERVLGYSRPELLEMSVIDMISPEFHSSALAALAGKLGGDTVETTYALEVVAKDGRRIPMEVNTRLLRRDGAPIGVQGVIRDISAHVATESALREREEQFRKLFESSPSPTAISIEATGEIVDGNAAWFAAVGYSAAEMRGRKADDFGLWQDAEMRPRLVAALAAGEPVRAVPLTFTRGDGELREALLSMERIEIGGVASLLTSLYDVTELTRAREERLAIERRLQEARQVESLAVLAGGIAHEFNNVLVGILGNAGLALMELPPGSPAHETVQEMEESARRAAKLAEQMLAYSGRGRVTLEPLHPAEVLTAAAAEVAALPAGAHLRIDADAALPSINGDAELLRQALTHLITNAAEAYAPQSTSGDIHIAPAAIDADGALFQRCQGSPALADGRYVRIEVRDHGSGIDGAVQARMFEPFFSTKFAGRGLGLAAVLGIARAHRGAVLVETAPGAGSSVSLLLPALPPS